MYKCNGCMHVPLYAHLVQTKNIQCKSAIILQCYHLHLSDFGAHEDKYAQCYNNAITGTNPYCWTLTDPRGGIILNKYYNTE